MTDPTIALKEYLINIGLEEDADTTTSSVHAFCAKVFNCSINCRWNLKWSRKLALGSMNVHLSERITAMDIDNVLGNSSLRN